MELIPIAFKKVMQSRAYTVVILGTAQKQFAIYTDPLVGKHLQLLLMGESLTRPYTHNLIDYIFKGLDIRVKQVIINNIEDTVYFARLFLEQQVNEQKIILEIDARPSDCLILALMHNAPVYCRREVLENAVAIEA